MMEGLLVTSVAGLGRPYTVKMVIVLIWITVFPDLILYVSHADLCESKTYPIFYAQYVNTQIYHYSEVHSYFIPRRFRIFVKFGI